MRAAPLTLLLLAGSLPVFGQTSVLFIGNSYTYSNDLPNTFRQLALSLGDTVTVGSSAPGGYTLLQHSTHAPTLEAIQSQQWDYMVMQEQSQLGALPAAATTTELGAASLMEDMEASFECTFPVFFMTWGRENGDSQFCGSYPYMCTYNGMQQALRDNYVYLANWYDAYTAPVGAAWKQVRDTQPLIDLYVDDGSHPSMAGTYLAACVFYCTLFQESCVDATFNASLDAGTAAILRGIASTTVLGEPETWNLDVVRTPSALLDGYSDGPNYITLIHHGQGTHLWTCSNGESFTTATATFTFTASGTYYVTHVYTDPCGNSDTANLTFPFTLTVGLDERDPLAAYRVTSTEPGYIQVTGAESPAQLEIFDTPGKLVLSTSVVNTTRIACPAGPLLWVIRSEDGRVVRGKVFVW